MSGPEALVDTNAETVALLASLTAGGVVDRCTWDTFDPHSFWRLAERHGVTPLVSRRLNELVDTPLPLRVQARELAHQALATDLLSEAALRLLLEAFHDAAVTALLMKGVMLAYTHYPRPDLRPRLDADLVISAADRRRAHDVLIALGYQPDIQASTELVMHQLSYTKVSSGGFAHVVDVHWRVANPEVFRQVLAFDEVLADAVPVAGLGPFARGLSDVHALLVACVHRVAHHFDDDRLIWLYDIHLIATRLADTGWEEFAHLAVERRVLAICRAGLQQCKERFGTSVPESFWSVEEPRAAREVTASYLTPHRPHVRVVVDDLRALPTWLDRWRMMRQYAFPPVDYMREIYAPTSSTPLVWLYAHRLFFGARRWLARSQ
jgi:hypothetical protein